MKKKVLIISLVAALVLGVLGLNAMAETEQKTAKPVATAMWTANNSVTVDGTASEANWMFDSWIRGATGTPKGSVAKLWNGTDLYLAVKTDGATSLKATLNTHVINVTLGATPVADVSGVTVKQSGIRRPTQNTQCVGLLRRNNEEEQMPKRVSALLSIDLIRGRFVCGVDKGR